MSYTKAELEKLTTIYDYLGPVIKEASLRKNWTLRPIMAEISKVVDKNSNVLQSNIIGRQFIFNKSSEEVIFKAMGVDLKQLTKVYDNSPYFKKMNLDDKEKMPLKSLFYHKK